MIPKSKVTSLYVSSCLAQQYTTQKYYIIYIAKDNWHSFLMYCSNGQLHKKVFISEMQVKLCHFFPFILLKLQIINFYIKKGPHPFKLPTDKLSFL